MPGMTCGMFKCRFEVYTKRTWYAKALLLAHRVKNHDFDFKWGVVECGCTMCGVYRGYFLK